MSRVPIERAALISAVTGTEPADTACQAALRAGAGYDLSSGEVAVAELIGIYERRVRHLSERHVETIGADTVVLRLRRLGHDGVRLGSVHSRDFNFTLFVEADHLNVVSLLAVAASAANPDWDWSGMQY